MDPCVLVCGNVFDGVSDYLTSSGEILVQGSQIADVAPSVSRSRGVRVIDLSERTVMPGSPLA